ncbi:MAG: DsrE family protein [Longimicrobiales bacterium]
MRTRSLTLVLLAVFAATSWSCSPESTSESASTSAASAPQAASGNQASTGPVVNAGGPTYPVPNPTFETPMDRQFKAVFELRAPAGSPDRPNQNLNTMARYLNMHVRAGVPHENVRVAGVVHGGAALELLQDEHYRAAHGVDNPNKVVIAEVLAGGGQLILCGQTAGRLGISADQLLPGVQLGLSAMTAMTVLQQDGYQVILW